MPLMTITPRQSGYPGYSETMDRTAETAGKARGLARLALRVWQLEGGEDSAVLLLSELFANAVRHARGTSVRVIIDRPGVDRVYLAVVDFAPYEVPQMREAAANDVDGRGLAMVEQLADRWGCDLMGRQWRPWGKRVWAEMRVR